MHSVPPASDPATRKAKDSTTMIRSHYSLLACLALSVACASQSSKGSDNPDAGQFDGYYSEVDGGATGGGSTADGGETRTPTGPAPKARASTSTRGGARKSGKALTLIAKKPPVESGEKDRPTRDLKGDFAVDGVFPMSASVGSQIEVFGVFPEEGSTARVFVGGKRLDVVEASADRLVAEVSAATTGPVEVGFGTGRLNRRNRAKTTVDFVGTPADAAFGQPRTKVGHGLLGMVYEIDEGATEVPVLNDLTPVSYIAVDDLDIPAGAAPAGVAGRSQSFAIHFMGSLNILEEGEYELCLNAGDGALLFLDQTPVIDVDGSGAAREVCEVLYVEPGEYGVDLVYYQGADTDAALTLSWAKDGGERQPIPAEAFFPPEDIYGIAAGINQGG